MPLFMVLYGSSKEQEAGKPTEEMLKAIKPIAEYHEQLARSGKLIWADSLYPSSQGARVITSESGQTSVQKGPFDTPSPGGYSVFNAASLDEAIEIVKSGPQRPASGCEIRQIASMEEFPIPEEHKAKAREVRELMGKNAAALRA